MLLLLLLRPSLLRLRLHLRLWLPRGSCSFCTRSSTRHAWARLRLMAANGLRSTGSGRLRRRRRLPTDKAVPRSAMACCNPLVRCPEFRELVEELLPE